MPIRAGVEKITVMFLLRVTIDKSRSKKSFTGSRSPREVASVTLIHFNDLQSTAPSSWWGTRFIESVETMRMKSEQRTDVFYSKLSGVPDFIDSGILKKGSLYLKCWIHCKSTITSKTPSEIGPALSTTHIDFVTNCMQIIAFRLNKFCLVKIKSLVVPKETINFAWSSILSVAYICVELLHILSSL